MVKFIARKLLIMCITVVLISLAVFYIITLPPGDFLTRYIGRLTAAGESVDPVMIAQLREQYALDQPFFVQYWRWFGNIVLRGDFGYSFTMAMPVTAIIKAYIVPTMALSLVTMLFTYLISIPIGIYSAVHQYSVGDYAFTAIGFLGQAIPNFLLAILLMFLSFKLTGDTMLGLYSLGMQNAPWSMAKVLDLLKHCIIPIIVIGTGISGACIAATQDSTRLSNMNGYASNAPSANNMFTAIQSISTATNENMKPQLPANFAILSAMRWPNEYSSFADLLVFSDTLLLASRLSISSSVMSCSISFITSLISFLFFSFIYYPLRYFIEPNMPRIMERPSSRPMVLMALFVTRVIALLAADFFFLTVFAAAVGFLAFLAAFFSSRSTCFAARSSSFSGSPFCCSKYS